MVPAETPKAVVDQLHAAFRTVVESEDGKKFLNGFASDPWTLTPDEAQAFWRKQVNEWGDFVRIAKIEPAGLKSTSEVGRTDRRVGHDRQAAVHQPILGLYAGLMRPHAVM